MRNSIILTLAILFACSGTAVAESMSKDAVIASGITWKGHWDWAYDDGLAKDHSSITVKSATEFLYVYGSNEFLLKGELGHSGGDKTAPLAAMLTLPSGDEVRFVWNSMNEVKGEFWAKGKRKASVGNNAPETTAMLRYVIPKGPPLFPGGGNGKRQPFEIDAGVELNLEVLFVDWSDHPKDTTNFDEMWKTLTSDGTLTKAFKAHGVNVNTNLHKSWKRMPKTLSHYFPENTGWNWKDYTHDSIRLLGTGADYPSNTIAVIVAPESSLAGFRSASGAHSGRNYRGIRKMITMSPEAYKEHYTTLMHEIGHGFGAPDTYPMTNPYHHRIGAYDMMADIVYATGFLGWTRYRNGWLGAERIKFLPEKGNYRVDIKKLSGSGVAMVVVPDPRKKTKYYVIEIGQDVVSREQFKARKGEKINTEGDRLIVYTVEYPAPGPRISDISIVPRTRITHPDKHGEKQWLNEASYVSNQKSTDSSLPFTLQVGPKNNDGFTIGIDVKTDVKVPGY